MEKAPCFYLLIILGVFFGLNTASFVYSGRETSISLTNFPALLDNVNNNQNVKFKNPAAFDTATFQEIQNVRFNLTSKVETSGVAFTTAILVFGGTNSSPRTTSTAISIGTDVDYIFGGTSNDLWGLGSISASQLSGGEIQLNVGITQTATVDFDFAALLVTPKFTVLVISLTPNAVLPNVDVDIKINGNNYNQNILNVNPKCKLGSTIVNAVISSKNVLTCQTNGIKLPLGTLQVQASLDGTNFVPESISLTVDEAAPANNNGKGGNNGQTGGANVGAIVGGIIAALIVVGLVIGAIIFIRRRKANGFNSYQLGKSPTPKTPKQQEAHPSPPPKEPAPRYMNQSVPLSNPPLPPPISVMPPTSNKVVSTPSSPAVPVSKPLPKHPYANSGFAINDSDLSYDMQIGEGSFGRVYRGSYQGQKVAIKLLKESSKEALDEFMKEMSTMSRVGFHPNVVKFVGVAFQQAQAGAVMVTEFCEGGSLMDHIYGKPKLKDTVIIKLLSGIASGMSHLASLGIVHRDLAARNILLMKNLVPKITDFGLSRFLAQDHTTQVTKSNVGPLKWMAPESILSRIYGEKTDVWAFGVLIVELVICAEPYPELDSVQAAARVGMGDLFPTVPSSSPYLAELLSYCAKTNPKERPTFKQLCLTLEDAMSPSQ